MRGATLAALAILALAACEDRELHVFGAQRFDPARGCLEAATTVDVIDGPDPGPCDAPRCWRSPGGEIFVTTTACDAPPDYADRTGDPPGSLCAAALEALAAGAACAP